VKRDRVIVAGAGPNGEASLTCEVRELIREVPRVLLRTERIPLIDFLRAEGIEYSSYDHFYDQAEDFAEVYQRMVEALLSEAAVHGTVLFLVPGHPLVGEAVTSGLLERSRAGVVDVRVLPGVSSLDSLFVELALDPAHGIQVIDALSMDKQRLNPALDLILLQVYSRKIAALIKPILMGSYPDDHEIWVVRGAGTPACEKARIPLFELDRLDWVDHATSVYVPRCLEGDAMEYFIGIVRRLRGEGGCPWDREQTHKSLRPYLLEETYEVLEALDAGDMNKLREELGDLLLQVVLHSVIAEEEGEFTLEEVAAGISEKLIRRHPHVFGDVRVSGTGDVLRNWEAIKRSERGERQESLLDGVPKYMPALSRAFEIQKRASRVGFDWPDLQGPLDKIREEMHELERALKEGPSEALEEEAGDLLFSVVNLCRFVGVDPEAALRSTVEKFVRRFQHIERELARRGLTPAEATLHQMDELWEEAKPKDSM